MSYSLDLNILLYASDENNPLHKRAKSFLVSRLKADDLGFLAWDTLLGYLRIATHPGIFKHPLTPKQAWGNVRVFLEHPRVEFLSHDRKSMETLATLIEEQAIRGNLVPDAALAALLEVNNLRRIYTHDRDFWKFPFLKPVDPFGEEGH